MSVQLTPSKRPNEAEANGRGKWQKSGNFNSQNFTVNGNILRVLCPSNKIGSVIGQGGSIIAQIRQESGAKIRVEEPVPGCDERIIVITCSDKDNGRATEQQQQLRSNKEENDENGETEPEKNDRDGNETNEDKKEDVPVAEVEGGEKETTSVMQKALFLVVDRLAEGDIEKDGGCDEEGDKESSFVVKLLVFSSQIGCLLGKEGSVIKQMALDSGGAQIQILQRDKLSPSDELVQISGVPDAVRKALSIISQQLLENPPHDQRSQSGYTTGASSHSVGQPSRHDPVAQPNHAFRRQGPPYSAGYRDSEAGFSDSVYPSQDMLAFRLWCPHDKIGAVIGKGGSVVKAIQNETGCEIKVLDAAADSVDRIIVISGPAYPNERISAPQDAVLRVQSRIFRASSETQEKNMTAKILVSSNQIGCLLGKGGSIIAEMRKSTGAYIRILGKDQNPQGALENEEVVQINGELETVQEALLQITTRLREHFFRDAFPSMSYPSNPAFLDQGPPFPPYMGGFHQLNERPTFVQNFLRPGFPPHMSERLPSSAAWGSQGPVEAGAPIGMLDFAGAPHRRVGGFGGGNHAAIITSTTVEVVVPRSVVPAIYGEDGGCLRQIREISDAKITITESKPGATETVIIIAGTPEQTNAAQSLIQAFVISETEAT